MAGSNCENVVGLLALEGDLAVRELRVWYKLVGKVEQKLEESKDDELLFCF